MSRKLPLASALLACTAAASASAQEIAERPDKTAAGARDTDIVVTGVRDSQIASESEQGLFGARDRLDTPFTQNTYTEELLRNQQVQSFGDALANDPAVRLASSPYTSQFNLLVRGVTLNARSAAYNGIFGLNHPRLPTIIGIGEVEVLHGPSAILFGINPTGDVGGVVNLVPKRATAEPLLRATGSYASDGQFGGAIDIGRRFGEARAFGARINGSYTAGETPVDLQSRREAGVSGGFDWRSDSIRASLDMGYQDYRIEAATSGLNILPGFAVPRAPDLNRNIVQPWEVNDYQNLFTLGKVSADMAPWLTASVAFGAARSDEVLIGSAFTILNAAGDARSVPTSNRQRTDALSGDAGLRATFATGPLVHNLAINVTGLRQTNHQNGFVGDGITILSNIYRPIRVAEPEHRGLGKPPLNSIRELGSYAIGDVISALDDRAQLTLGLRRQETRLQGFSLAIGARTSDYEEGKTTPSASLVIKPRAFFSVYASYTEGFGFGPTAPADAANAGEVFPPTVSTQYEAGGKLEFKKFGATFAYFRITQPSAFTDPATRVFALAGRQRNEGVELNMFGEPFARVRLIGGVTYVDGILTKTQGGLLDGRKAPGVPHWTTSLNAEYDPPFLPGFTVNARLITSSRQFVDRANTQNVPSWQRLDLGARHAFTVGRTALVARLNMLNATNEDYYATSNGSLALGQPRVLLASMEVGL